MHVMLYHTWRTSYLSTGPHGQVFWGLLPRNGILPAAKITLHPSLAFSYIDSAAAWHSSRGRQPNFVA